MNASNLRSANYASAVLAFMGSCEEGELHRRCTICLIRDMAAKAKQRCTDEAFPIYDHIDRLATLNVYAPMPVDRLRDLQLILTLLAAQAHDLDEWARA